MDKMRRVKLGEPSEARYIGYVITFENRHLSETRQGQKKERHQITVTKDAAAISLFVLIFFTHWTSSPSSSLFENL